MKISVRMCEEFVAKSTYFVKCADFPGYYLGIHNMKRAIAICCPLFANVEVEVDL